MRDDEKTKQQLIMEIKEFRERFSELMARENEHEMKEEGFKQRLEFERTLAIVSSRFVGFYDLDVAINSSLEDIGKHSNADRAYIFLVDGDGTKMSNTHEWCEEKIEPQKDKLQDLPAETFPWWSEKLQNGEVIHIPDVSSLPTEAKAEKDILEEQNIKSLLCLPFFVKHELAGFIGFDDVKAIGEWDSKDIIILGMVSEIIGNAIERKRAEETIQREQERAQQFFDMAPVVMLALNDIGEVTNINEIGCSTLGYLQENVVGMNWFEQFIPDHAREGWLRIFRMMMRGEIDLVENIEFPVITDGGKIRTLEWQNSHLKKNDGKIFGALFSGKDITDRKKAEEHLKKRLMTYKLEDGHIYIVKESSLDASLKAFNDLLKVGYNGVVISRTPENELKRLVGGEISYYWLAEMENGQNVPPALQELEGIFDGIKRKTVVLLERLDYIISKNSFDEVLECIQRLCESAYLYGFILIISIDPVTINKGELRLIEKEGKELEPILTQVLSNSLIEVLEVIDEQNSIGLKPSYSFLGNELGISKPTLRKRIATLISDKYVNESIMGRRKILELTEKGKNLFKN